ncbi:MAG: glycine cleavage system protein H, partial [Planctomycetales bacterium]
SPVTGEVLQANQQLENDLGALSADPFGAGWLLKVRIDANGVSEALLDRAAYERHWESRAH